MNTEITIAYVNYWQDPKNDNYFTKFIENNICFCKVVSPNENPDILIASVFGDINNVNDFLDFKLSIKTILVIVFFWGVICFFVFLFMVGGINNAIDFINNNEKMSLLSSVNDILNINKFPHNKLIFVYSAPKVGSTSIVSSLRIFGTDKFSIIHIHDEEMLKVLGHINGITINEIILYNKHLGKDVYVIDVYRSPIERKISAFF